MSSSPDVSSCYDFEYYSRFFGCSSNACSEDNDPVCGASAYCSLDTTSYFSSRSCKMKKGLGLPCSSSLECQGTLVCNATYKCHADPTITPCPHAFQDFQSGQCHNRTCKSAADCGSDGFCTSSKCHAKETRRFSPCSHPEECASPLSCINATCSLPSVLSDSNDPSPKRDHFGIIIGVSAAFFVFIVFVILLIILFRRRHHRIMVEQRKKAAAAAARQAGSPDQQRSPAIQPSSSSSPSTSPSTSPSRPAQQQRVLRPATASSSPFRYYPPSAPPDEPPPPYVKNNTST